MDETLTFIGTFRIPDDESWLAAIDRMTDFVATHVPRVKSFHAFANADRTEGTVIYIHPDAESLDQHLRVAAELIAAGTEMVDVIGVELLGSPNPATVEKLREDGTPVSVKRLVRGFSRV